MNVRHDLRNETVAPTTEEHVRRMPRPVHVPGWLLPVAIALLATVAVILGISYLLSRDDGTTVAYEPLIVPEEQAYIDSRVGPPGRLGVGTARAATPAPVTVVDMTPSMRPSGVPSMVGYYEQEYIEARVPGALLSSPASVGFPQLVGEYEQAYIDASTAPLPRVQALLVTISQRPSGVPGQIDYYEQEYIEARVPGALLPSPATVGFPQLMEPEELAFASGDYRHPSYGLNWCDTHTPC